jgi:hypothetical protein
VGFRAYDMVEFIRAKENFDNFVLSRDETCLLQNLD